MLVACYLALLLFRNEGHATSWNAGQLLPPNRANSCSTSPEFGRIQADSVGHRGHETVDACSDLGPRVFSNLGQRRSTSAALAQDRPDWGQAQPRPARDRPKYLSGISPNSRPQHWPGIGQHWPGVGQRWAEIDQTVSKLTIVGWSSTKVARKRPMISTQFDPTSTESDQHRMRNGQIWLEIHQIWPAFGRSCATWGSGAINILDRWLTRQCSADAAARARETHVHIPTLASFG